MNSRRQFLQATGLMTTGLLLKKSKVFALSPNEF